MCNMLNLIHIGHLEDEQDMPPYEGDRDEWKKQKQKDAEHDLSGKLRKSNFLF